MELTPEKIEISKVQLNELLQQNADLKTLLKDLYSVYIVVEPMINSEENLMQLAARIPKILRKLKSDETIQKVFNKDFETTIKKYL